MADDTNSRVREATAKSACGFAAHRDPTTPPYYIANFGPCQCEACKEKTHKIQVMVDRKIVRFDPDAPTPADVGTSRPTPAMMSLRGLVSCLRLRAALYMNQSESPSRILALTEACEEWTLRMNRLPDPADAEPPTPSSAPPPTAPLL